MKFPGDKALLEQVAQMESDIANDALKLTSKQGVTWTKRSIAQTLSQKHNQKQPGQTTSNSDFLGKAVGADVIETALMTCAPLSPAAMLKHWVGYNYGHWYSENRYYVDPAVWAPVTGSAPPLMQKVTWYVEKKHPDGHPPPAIPVPNLSKTELEAAKKEVKFDRDGWNACNAQPFLWGWDPKNKSNPRDFNTHLGYYTDRAPDLSIIVWFTPNVMFLECITTGGYPRRKTSASLFGCGQWYVYA